MAPLKRSRVVLLLAGVVLLFVLVRWAHLLPPLADVAPSATCGNNRCEIGEKATVRIAPPNSVLSSSWGTLQYGSFGRFIAPAGDLDADGVTDIAVGGIKTVGGNYGNTGMIWFIKLNRDGTAKELSPTQPDYGYQTYPLTYGSAYATLGKINGIGDSMSVFSDLDDFSYGKQIVRAGANGQNVTIADFAATSIANIGDINGDGIPDVALGRGGADGGPVTTYGVGTVTIITLSQTLAVLSSHTIPSAEDGFPSTVWPSTEKGVYRFGKSVAALGDLNGDGKKEIAVGGNGVWILSLNSDGTVASKKTIVPGESFSVGNDGDYTMGFGASLADIGDWNGDSIPDLAVSSKGFVAGSLDGSRDSPIWILYLNRDGTVKGTKVLHASDFGMFTSYVPGYNDTNDITLASIPDMDGDGKQELVLGDPGNINCNGSNTYQGTQGAVLLLLSKQVDACPKDCNWCTPPGIVNVTQAPYSPFTPKYTLPTCNNGTCESGELNPMAIPGPQQTDPYESPILTMAKVSLGDMGDFDGDGGPDIVVAGKTQIYSENHTGEVALIFLNRNGSLKSNHRIYEGAGGLLTGRESAKHFVAAVAVLGDVDGDGVKDIAVTASTPDQNLRYGSFAPHSVYILFLKRDGTVKGWKEISQQDAGVISSTLSFGSALAGLGDFDGDGVPDLAAGSLSFDISGNTNGTTEDQRQGGRVHLLMLNRDGSVKSSKILLASAFYGSASLESDATYHQQYLRFGSPLVSFGNLFGDGRRLLMAGGMMIFLNADGSVNSFRRMPNSTWNSNPVSTPISVADAGDMDGDGRNDLAMVLGSFIDNSSWDLSGVGYYSIATNGDLTELSPSLNSNVFSLSVVPYISSLSSPFFITVPDLDADGLREAVFLNNEYGTCPTTSYGNGGLAMLAFSGEGRNICSDDCNSVNVCYTSPEVVSSSSFSSVVPSSSSVSAVVSSAFSLSSAAQSAGSTSTSSSFTSSFPATVSSSLASVASSISSQAGTANLSSSASSASSSASSPPATSSASSASSSPATSSASSALDSSVAYNIASSVSSQTAVASSAASSRVSSYTQQYSSISFTDDSTPSPRCGDGQLSPYEQCDTGHPCPDGGFCMSGCRCQARSSAARSSPSFLPPQFSSFSSADAVPYSMTSSRPFLAQGRATSSPSLHPSLAAPPSRPSSFCGNTTLEPPETCDDGNTVNGDGCSSFCQKEIPNVVASQPLCGNGVVEEGEQCDPPGTLPGPPGQAVRTGRAGDGNQLDRDGCSASCTFEILPVTNADGSFRPSVIAGSTDPSLFLSSAPSIARIGPTPQIAPRLRPAGTQPPSAPSVDHSAPVAPVSNVAAVPAPVSIATFPQQPASWQYQASVIPYAPVGPVGATGPASLVIMASGAAAGFALMRQKRRG